MAAVQPWRRTMSFQEAHRRTPALLCFDWPSGCATVHRYVGSTKSLSGHALGAAGVHEAIYSLLMLNRGFLAESANIDELVEEAEGMNILTARYEGEVSRVMSNSFGFGGTNACLVFDKYTE